LVKSPYSRRIETGIRLSLNRVQRLAVAERITCMGWNSAIELGCPDEVGQVIVSTGIWIATLPGER
jgi:hypothetical protein